MAEDFNTVGQRIDDLESCERRVDAEAAFTPGDDYRAVVRLVLAAAETIAPPVSESRLEDLKLAVTEACTNAVKVHRVEALSDPVVVSCHIESDRVRVEVRDRGPGFDPEELDPLPDPEDPERLRYEHGLGVQLITELADEVTFRAVQGGTLVSISMYR